MGYRKRIDGDAADVTKLFQDLVGQGSLVQDGQGRWTRYCLPVESYSVHMDDHSVHKEINDSVQRTEISQDQMDALLLIAEPARRNRRLVPAEMEQVILKLCRGCWLNRRQLADLLDRNPDGLRSRFLTQMVGHGLLQLRYPDKPNRVDQAYSSTRL